MGTRKKRTAKHAIPRPVTVHYPWGRTGYCKSVRSAIVCVTRHMMDPTKDLKRANIEIDGTVIADLDKTLNRVVTNWKKGWLNYGMDEA
jgi:hypothetical protein